MANLKINTEAVVTAAEHIRNINNQIRDGFSSVQEAVSRLDSSWDGSAATGAINKFNEIKMKLPDVRYNVMNNYATFLLQQVGEGYTQTETANTSLADAFK